MDLSSNFCKRPISVDFEIHHVAKGRKNKTREQERERDKKEEVRHFFVSLNRGSNTLSTKMDYSLANMSKSTRDNIQTLLKALIFATIAGAAISARLFSVVRYLPDPFSHNPPNC